jgi:holo-[acyl-carrier protein] synthase
MIYGIGTDIIQLSRIAGVFTRHGMRFPEKILGPDELEKYRSRNIITKAHGIRFLASRFAAKEAFSKALGIGMHMPMTWQNMQTLNISGGKPIAMVSGVLKEFMEKNRLTSQISISDEIDYAVAFVIVEQQ